MTLGKRIALIWLPIITIPVYFLVVAYLPEQVAAEFLSELGPIELGTAVLFLTASGLAVWHCHQHRAKLPTLYRLSFLAFASGAFFIAMEELSYGQHLFGFDSPKWFELNNKQAETNLHNLLGSKPSRLIRSLGNIAVPVFFVLLPLVYASRESAWKPGHWTFYLLPNTQLVVLAILASAVTFPGKFSDTILPYSMTARLGEFKEFYFATVAVLYIVMMYTRQQSAAAAQRSDANLRLRGGGPCTSRRAA